jgi:16S rRNA (cytidine1402-2'-O)-methyltransferase
LVNREVDIDAITFFELNKHTDPAEIESFLKPVLDGNDIGILSEAGLPGIADPGAAVVRMAHQRKLNVVPFVGPSSIFLALMASGLNGQSFRFTGYLPIRTSERVQAIRNLEQRAHKEDETQIFIETPYRNNSLLDDLLSTCGNQTLLTIAADISTESEFIQTASIEGWKKKKPDLHKRPAVFLIGI